MSFDRRKIRTGTVVSDKMEKTLVVNVEWRQLHRIYDKSVKRITKLMVHDPENQGKLGDVVRVIETRPISKTKRWRLVEVLSLGDIADVQPGDIKVDEDVLVAPRQHAEAHDAVDDEVETSDQ
jgi:small subunit ribosomal protein S17